MIIGNSLTSMTGAGKPVIGATSRPNGTNVGNDIAPPGPPKEQPPGLTPRGVGNGMDMTDPTRVLMMNMAGSRLLVPKRPHVAQLQQWLILLGKNLVSISPLNDCAEIRWLQEVKEKSFEYLADPGPLRFQKMDF